MESASKAMNNFDAAQEYAVFGYIRECQQLFPVNNIYYTIPLEIIDICLLFYQTERFKESSQNITISSSEFFEYDVGSSNFENKLTYNPDSKDINGYLYGAFKINSQPNLKRIEWKFRIIKACPMRIGITADKLNIDNVLHVNGKHRFHTLSYLGMLESHRSHERVCDFHKSIFIEHDIITMRINMEKQAITFYVDNKNGVNIVSTVGQTINFQDEYKLVVYMCGQRAYYMDTVFDGIIQLLDFQMLQN